MKRFLIAFIIFTVLGAATLSCCFNPFFYMPVERPDTADTKAQHSASATKADGIDGANDRRAIDM